jgi:hypothetical protein
LQKVLAVGQELLEDAVAELEVLEGPGEGQFADEGFLIVLGSPLDGRKFFLDHSVQFVAFVEVLVLLVEFGD